MWELLTRLEYRRQALRRRVLAKLGISGDGHFALAGALFLLMIVPPFTGVELIGIIPLVIGAVILLPLAPILL